MIDILHIDDSRDDLELTRIQLHRRDKSLRIVSAESADHAIALLEGQRFDIIICDYQMPGFDGLDFLRMIRERDEDIPFAFLTGQGSEDVAAEAMRSGADAYYTKEIGFAHYQRLLMTIHQLVEAHREKLKKTQAEAALRESEERYRRIVQTAEEGIWSVDRRGVTTFVNAKMAQMLGYASEEMVGRSLFRFMSDEWKQIAIAKLQEGGPTEERHFEFQCLRKDGGALWALVSTNPIYDESGRLIGGLAMVTDITERKKALDALRESEERFRTAFHTSPDSVNINRMADGRCVDINEGFTALTGFTREDVIGRTSLEINIWHDLRDRERLRRGLEHDGCVRNLEAKFRLKDGSLRTGLLSAKLINLEGVPHILSVTRDIEDWKRAQEALFEAESKYRALFESSKDVVYLSTVDGKFIDINPAGCELFGYTKEELLKLDVETLFHRLADRAEFRRAIEERGFVRDYPVTFVKKTGELIEVLETASLQFDRDGATAGYQGIIRDVTEKKRAERELKEQEEKYHSLFSHSNDMIFLHDLEGNIIDINNKAIEHFGYPREEFLGLRISDLHPEEALRKSREVFIAIAKEGHVAFEIDFRKKDGSTFNAEVSSSVIEFSGKRVVQGIVRDVSERKGAEEELRRERDFNKRLMETSPVGIVEVSADGRIRFANPQAVKVLGLSKDSITQRTYNDPEWRITDFRGGPFPEDKLPLPQVLSTTKPVYDVRHAIEWPDGRRVLLSINASPLIDAQGGVDGMVAMVADVTEQIEAECALRESEERYRAFVEQSSEGIFRLGYDQPIPIHLQESEIIERFYKYAYVAECNVALAKMYGCESPEELVGTRMSDLHSDPESIERNIESQRISIRAGFRAENVETVEHDKHGNRKYFLNSAVGIIRDGCLVGVWGTQRDITERKQAELVQDSLYKIADAAAHAKDLWELYRAIHDSVQELIDADNFFIALHEGGLRFSFPYFIDEVDGAFASTEIGGKGLTAYVFRTGKPLMVDEKSFAELVDRGEAELVGTPARVWLGVPLKTAAATIGVMAVQSYRDSSVYSSRDLELMSFISGQVAAAIERRRALDAHQLAEERYTGLIENAGMAIVQSDADGRFVYINKRFAELLAYEPEELRGKAISDVVHPDDLDKVMGFHKRRVAGEVAPLRYSFKGLCKGGSPIELEAFAEAMSDKAGSVGTRAFIWRPDDEPGEGG